MKKIVKLDEEEDLKFIQVVILIKIFYFSNYILPCGVFKYKYVRKRVYLQ